MKFTWPTQEFCVVDPGQPIFHLFALGVCVGGNVNFSLRIGGIAQRDGPMRVFSHGSRI